MTQTTVLCLASEHKGNDFIRQCKAMGCRVYLITEEKFRDRAWPREALDEIFFMPDLSKQQDVLYGVSYLARHNVIDCIVPLDDYDVGLAAALREHLRVPGMGGTTGRYFRDKLAMRMKARESGLLVPDFVHILNHEKVAEFMARVPAPWVLKPRFEAGAIGIKKMHNPDEVWQRINELGDKQSFHLLEQFVPGDVYHIDSIVSERELIFARPSKYGRPPLTVSHDGGVFITRTLPQEGEEAQALVQLTHQLLDALGLVRGVGHTEFIRSHADGEFYFLETAARVGGANIAETVEAATGVSLWQEWARIEVAKARGEIYQLPEVREDYAGILICLAKQEWPNLSGYTADEIVWRINKAYHAGLIVASSSYERVQGLLDEYSERFVQDFLAVGPKQEAKRVA